MNILEEGLKIQAASLGHTTEAKAAVLEPRNQFIAEVIATLHDLIGDTDRYEMYLLGDDEVDPHLEIHGEWMRSDDVKGLVKKLEKALKK